MGRLIAFVLNLIYFHKETDNENADFPADRDTVVCLLFGGKLLGAVRAQRRDAFFVLRDEIGSTDQGGLYFTMKRIAGSNFFQVLQRMSWSRDDMDLV